MGLYDYTVYNIIVRNAKVLGDQIGWIFGEERITHGQFLQRIDGLASGLLSVGLGRGDRIGVPDEQWGEAIKAVYVSQLPKTEDGAIDRMKVKEEHGGI